MTMLPSPWCVLLVPSPASYPIARGKRSNPCSFAQVKFQIDGDTHNDKDHDDEDDHHDDDHDHRRSLLQSGGETFLVFMQHPPYEFQVGTAWLITSDGEVVDVSDVEGAAPSLEDPD